MNFVRQHDHAQVSGRLIDVLDDLESAQERMREEVRNITHEEATEPFEWAQNNLSFALCSLRAAISDVQKYQEAEVRT